MLIRFNLTKLSWAERIKINYYKIFIIRITFLDSFMFFMYFFHVNFFLYFLGSLWLDLNVMYDNIDQNVYELMCAHFGLSIIENLCRLKCLHRGGNHEIITYWKNDWTSKIDELRICEKKFALQKISKNS